MIVCLVLLCCCLILLLVRNIRTRMALKYLLKQLDEIEHGSHIELAVSARQKQIIKLCKKLNRIFAQSEENRIQYERAERRLMENITSLAHDIRTPLTGARGYVQMAEECGDDERHSEYLVSASRRMTELSDMLEELFLYTKLTGEEYTLNIQQLQALPLLSDCLLGMYQQFEERGMEPVVEFASEGFSVNADEEALRRIFLNLIQNALVHGSGNLKIIQKENSLIFENSVAETNTLNPMLIFDRFYKGDKTRRRGSSGLGLFIVKELMERMNGNVLAELTDGELRITLIFAD